MKRDPNAVAHHHANAAAEVAAQGAQYYRQRPMHRLPALFHYIASEQQKPKDEQRWNEVAKVIRSRSGSRPWPRRGGRERRGHS